MLAVRFEVVPRTKRYTLRSEKESVFKGGPGSEPARTDTRPCGSRTAPEIRVRPKTEIIVRPAVEAKNKPSGVVLFFGRVWTKVVKGLGGKNRFEVESANAIAGVRGTEFEVGVADDGSTRVIVSEGRVGVTGDDRGRSEVDAGYEVQSDGRGRLAQRRRVKADPGWDGWFARRARRLEKKGLQVARDLKSRLDRRRDKLERLVGEQRRLRKEIEALEANKGRGATVDDELEDRLSRLERVTERLVDMKTRLEAGFGMFERWGGLAQKGVGGEALGRMAGDVEAIARDFADLFEEGTDLSQEGMEEMMQEMKDGPTLDPRKQKNPKNAKDELF